MTEEQQTEKINWYDKNYKLLLLIPLALLLSSFIYLGIFYFQTGDFIKKDVSLTGGTTITIFSEQEINLQNLEQSLSEKLDDFSIREISDFRTGKQEAVIIEIPLEDTSSEEYDQLISSLEEYLNYKLIRGENFDVVSTGSSLSNDFYKQLIYAIILSFSFMAIVVFFIFGGQMKIKLLSIFLTLIPIILFFSRAISVNTAIITNLIALLINITLYIRYSIPSVAVVLSAFADITMTLAFVNFLGLKLSSAGIIAFLMLIGYSVDTDIMLTTRLLKRKESEINKRLLNAFKTGMTMTISSIVAVGVALIFTYSFSEVLRQIFTILLIGLVFDLLNTWITNASILKWYLEKQ